MAPDAACANPVDLACASLHHALVELHRIAENYGACEVLDSCHSTYMLLAAHMVFLCDAAENVKAIGMVGVWSSFGQPMTW